MEQFEQLLTCAICLDRYRNPKLLPCQHSFCMEPCMDGLVDYVRRQVKCPECRAEHRIPYQGVQGYPTNVTLQRFLELHIEITGELPDPTAGQIMERCGVCSEKAYCGMCGHCDKKICQDCKGAHMDILRREIARINNQVRRALHRLQDMLAMVDKNLILLQQNCGSVAEEVDEIDRRLAKALKDRTEHLRQELDRYLSTEVRNLTQLKENLELEISNITSNCDLADKHMTESVEWDDNELMDAKEIFLKTVEFIRNFETETGDYQRRVRFTMAHDPNQLVNHVAGFGDLNINHPHTTAPGLTGSASMGLLQTPGPGLMRSKSDHRLATQFRQQEERDEDPRGGRLSPLAGRKFGERPAPKPAATDRYEGRYGRGGESGYGGDYGDYDAEGGSRAGQVRSKYRSRFRRDAQDAAEPEPDTGRNVRFQEQQNRERERVLDTEDVSKGPLSGITRLYDVPRVMKRLQESELKEKNKGKEPPTPPQPAPQQQQPKKTVTQRQVSEEDEIAKIKRQNKSGASSSDVAAAVPEAREPAAPVRPAPDRVASLKKAEEERRRGSSHEGSSDNDSDDGSSVSSMQVKQKYLSRGSATPSTPPAAAPAASRTQQDTTPPRFQSRFLGGNRPQPDKAKDEEEDDDTESSSEEETDSDEEEDKTKKKEEVNRMDIGPLLARSANARDSATATRRDSRDDTGTRQSSTASYRSPLSSRDDSGGYRSQRASRDESTDAPSSAGSRYGSAASTTSTPSSYTSRFLNKSKSSANVDEDESSRAKTAAVPDESTRYPSGRSRYAALKERRSRLARSRSSHNMGGADDMDDAEDLSATTSPSAYLASRGYGSSQSGSELARSRSTHALKSRDNSPERGGERDGTALSSWARTRARSVHALKSREASPERDTADRADRAERDALSQANISAYRSRARQAALKSRETSPERGAEKDANSPALSSWARYLKNKYGPRKEGKDGAASSASSAAGSAASSAASRRLSLGLPLSRHNSASIDSSDDDQKNPVGSPTSPTAATAAAAAGFAAGATSPRSQYLQKRRQLFQIGSRGSEPGAFTWPRGIAVGPDNTFVIADSSNHRVQVFDSNGIFVKEFGSYGNGEGEFDCLAGVAVNRIGQFIIADRYNHRIQVMDPSGRFLRAFGSQGTADGRFNYPWGITTDALGFIYVCDKENHRVQVFQSDGTFVGKFGSSGRGPGQLEHPHYIAVSSTNRVIVSDSNNHRIQIFDVNGRVITSFGSEGSEEGQFKFPRGVAVDDQGYIFVGDSGNNRIQIFHPDGAFLRAFGCWGAGPAEFKGLEGVAVLSDGKILVCDRENHRVQVF
ncbi:RING finger protein nhl-1 isoform X2 [Thrips palmi]|uniref:RING finger protein nhl-1 isoform X2 n=1 Tax=Thrips palmi TaxID=161013 RepID=A0A6P8ZNB3_THRPL|nr:RING finger protein nhl-1 isoform X2 [Thrips palmi]